MTDSRSQIAIDQLGLGSVLKQNRLVVPPNQREYAWTEREVQQLFQDFAKAITDNEPGYFLGTVVTIPRENNTLEVVDGQQRLATTAILLAAIRDYLMGKEDVLVEAINNEFLTGIDRSRRSRIPKLKLNLDDNEFFRSIVTPPPDDVRMPKPAKASHERLAQTYDEAQRHVLNLVSALDQRDHGDLLNSWVSFLENRALVVLLRVPSEANAYKMFETLNDRGLRTSQADLIKNYLFGQAVDRSQEVQSLWSYMRGVLESLEDENITFDFLRHALIVIRGHTRQAQVYDVVQDIVRGEQAVVTFLTKLEVLATAYVATFNPAHEQWNRYPESVRRAIEVFNLLDVRPIRPVLLSIAVKFSPNEAAQAFQFLISLGVRLLIKGSTRSGSIESSMAHIANYVFSGQTQSAQELKSKLHSVTPLDEEFRSVFETTRVSKAQLARYYLRCLEQAARGEKEPWFLPTEDPTIINLEHILPKNHRSIGPNLRVTK